jgi:hypothetical protein
MYIYIYESINERIFVQIYIYIYIYIYPHAHLFIYLCINKFICVYIYRELGYSGPIFGVTGNVLPSDVDHFLSKGADVVLGKPLKISELKAAIRMYYRNDDY